MDYSKFGTDDTYSKYTKDNNKFIFHELVDDVSNLDFMDQLIIHISQQRALE